MDEQVDQQEAAAAAVTGTAPDVDAAPKPEQPKSAGKGPKKAVLVSITRKYLNPETGASVVVVEDPAKGIFTETTTLGKSVTVTTHQTFSHAWARLTPVK
jgi:hypothetical protein